MYTVAIVTDNVDIIVIRTFTGQHIVDDTHYEDTSSFIKRIICTWSFHDDFTSP